MPPSPSIRITAMPAAPLRSRKSQPRFFPPETFPEILSASVGCVHSRAVHFFFKIEGRPSPQRKLSLPVGEFTAYLFDCDGTIADSMPLHYMAWKKALAEWNCEFDERLFYAWGGMPTVEIVSTLNQRLGLNMP